MVLGWLGHTKTGGSGEPTDAGDRPGSEPAELGETQPGTAAEVTTTAGLPTNPPREASQHQDLPSELSVWSGTQPSESAGSSASHAAQPEFSRALYPLTEQNLDFLERWCGLTLEIVAPFAHRLRNTSEGHLIAPHNGEGDGEEYGRQVDGSVLESFAGGSEENGRGRGPSVWYADLNPPLPSSTSWLRSRCWSPSPRRQNSTLYRGPALGSSARRAS